jgi:DNA helicase-2/ATP-dependent DNA helicase PcrA
LRFHADLHIHSKYSRATSRDCDLEHLAYWARKKGITVVGTGDFTHPVWLAELKEKLVPAEPGLFRLKPELERHVADQLPRACDGPTRFMLSVEISTIYKKGELTRKIHHLIYAPDFEVADRIAARLARIGNIASDGRPILGLDSRNLLEIALEASPGAYLVPAHIWTPWFAVLGSRSGFDTVAECYGDLADHVFAVETGLSSDPEMNWRLSFLDRYRLVSNSDAHSPGKLGREATRFDTDLDYFALRRALETGQGYVGTVEFFPEEGKYHLDGHRKCGVRWTPEETRRHGGRCPVCGQPVTVGVMHRVAALADRAEGQVVPATAGDVSSLVPLPEILSELTGAGPGSQKVERGYEKLIGSLGAELSILESVPVEDIRRAESSLLAEAIERLRAGKVIRDAGYDGEYGVIRLFEDSELRRLTAGGVLFDAPLADKKESQAMVAAAAPLRPPLPNGERVGVRGPEAPVAGPILAVLDPEQRAAASCIAGPLMIIAGPGSGKTRTLTYRVAHLIADCGVAASSCLAITFTRRAAAELRERLTALVPAHADEAHVHTFHSLGLAILQEHANAAGLQRGFRVADDDERAELLRSARDVSAKKAASLLKQISLAKRTQEPPKADIAAVLSAYQAAMGQRNWIDFDDLVGLPVQLLSADAGLAAHYRDRFRAISVDEFQDVDAQQYALIRLLAPPGGNLCVIGDPNQAIYGFRGADAACFARFEADYAGAAVVRLTRNYRSSGTIVAASAQIIGGAADATLSSVVRDLNERITIHVAPTERAEAEFVVHSIERLIGGHNFFSIDSGRAASGAESNLSFSDFAVLYRTEAQSAALREAFARSGMPFTQHSHGRLIDAPAVQAILHEADGRDGDIRAELTAAADRLAAAEPKRAVETRAALPLLLALLDACGGDGQRFFEALPLATEADVWDPRADRVSLLTLHAAKGLEFPVVFIVGLEDGVLPLRWGAADSVDEEEERRLFYVGITRAKDRLLLSRAERRLWRGQMRDRKPSRYLTDIETELIEHSRRTATPKKNTNLQMELF